MEQYVIIVAGGKGLRMGSDVPKQFIELQGQAIIIRTIKKFKQVLPNARLVLVLPKTEIERWKLLSERFSLSDISIAYGGKNRFESVKSGLKEVSPNSIVGIHDSVRPFVSEETIKSCFQAAELTGNAIPVIELNDSIRKIKSNESFAVDRSDYRLVQTPQCFQAEMILDAYSQEYNNSFTDDASVVESKGVKINLVQGNIENIKITNPTDLIWAESFLSALN